MKNCKFDIIIQAGQSNAEGMGRGEVANEYLPTDKVYQLNASKKVEHTPEKVIITYADRPLSITIAEERTVGDVIIGDFSLPFAREYINSGLLKEDRKLLIIKAGIGGTGFKKGNWGIGNQLYNKLLEMTDYALSLNKENRVVAFLWHQGEHDAFEGNNPSVFEARLSDMFLDFKKHYGNMPIIAGDFVNEWKQKNIESCAPIVEKIKSVLNTIGNSAFIETSDLLSNNQKISNGDDIHFCRESVYELGKRYFNEFYKLNQAK